MTNQSMDIDISRDCGSDQWSEISDGHIRQAFDAFQQHLENHPLCNQEVSVLLTTSKQVHVLNKQYRDKDKSTNILSFPIDDIGTDHNMLGDLILAYEVVKDEAETEGKSFQDHVTHLLLHGLLHLLGYDHIEDDEAEKMEALEIETLQKMGIKNPYA